MWHTVAAPEPIARLVRALRQHLGSRMPVMSRRTVLARGGLVVAALVVGAVLAELVLRVLGLGYGNTHMEPSDVLHHVHAKDHRFISYHRSQEYGGHLVYYDPEGLRASPTRSAIDAAPAEFVVAFVGDSFVEALQVSHEESFVGRLQAAAGPRTRVHNYGTSGYGPLLYLLQWRTQIRQAAPTHVFLLLYSNDVRDDTSMTAIAQDDGRGEVVAVPGPRQTWATRLGRTSHLGRFLTMARLQLLWAWEYRDEERHAPVTDFVEENPDITDPTDRTLHQLVDEIRRSGAGVALMAVPSKERTLRRQLRTAAPAFDDKVQAWAERNAVPFIDLGPAFYAAADTGAQPFLVRDIHFTSGGHALVANTITEACPKLFAKQPDQDSCVAR